MSDYTEKNKNREHESDEQMDKPFVDLASLGPYIFDVFNRAEIHRRECGMEEELLQCLYQSRSEYDPQEKAKRERANTPIVYFPISDTKRRSANAWTSEIFLNSAKPPFTLRATPVPDVSPADAAKIADETIESYIEWQKMIFMEAGVPEDQAEMMVMSQPPDIDTIVTFAKDRRDEEDNRRMELAQQKVDRMYKLCYDQMVEGKWMQAMTAVVDCAATYGTGLLKGPILRSRKRNKFTNSGKVKLEAKDVWEWESINPFDAFPSKGAVEIGDGDFCQRVRFTPRELASMKRLGEEYNSTEIDRILSVYPNGGCLLQLSSDSERKRLENDGTARGNTDTMIEGIEFWGDVRGSLLHNIGIFKYKDEDIDGSEYYEINAIVVDKAVLFCTLSDERLGRPIYKGTFYKTQGSWWGDSPMQKMRDVQRVCNGAWSSMCVNMAQASGPMIFSAGENRLPKNWDGQIKPWMWQVFKDTDGRGTLPIKLFQANSNSAELQNILDNCIKQADIVTGIPAYSHGSDIAAGAGRTSSGLAMLMGAATRGMKSVVNSLSYDILVPAITYQYRLNMLFEKDDSIKGDAEVDVGGVLAILLKEQNRQNISDILVLAQNPAVLSVIGEGGISELLRTYVSLIEGINPDRIVPTRDEVERKARMKEIEQQLQAAEARGMASGVPSVPPAPPSPMQNLDLAGGRAPTAPEVMPARPARTAQTQPEMTTEGAGVFA